MSFIATIFAYWSTNLNLTTAIPYAGVWNGLAPEAQAFPYVVITAVALTPTPTTGLGYFASLNFDINIYHTDPDVLETLADTVGGQFDYKKISALTISCERQDGPTFVVDPDSPEKVYHARLSYNLLENRTLPEM